MRSFLFFIGIGGDDARYRKGLEGVHIADNAFMLLNRCQFENWELDGGDGGGFKS